MTLSFFQVQLLTPHPGWVEMDPEVLWNSVVRVVKNAIAGSYLSHFTSQNERIGKNMFQSLKFRRKLNEVYIVILHPIKIGVEIPF